jgi:hypothetical protein
VDTREGDGEIAKVNVACVLVVSHFLREYRRSPKKHMCIFRYIWAEVRMVFTV